MRVNRAFFLPFALLCALSACGAKPDYETVNGDSGRFADLHGRWVFVNYWAEWCKPCLKELPALKAFQDQYAKEAVVLAVNFDGPPLSQLRQQIAKLNVQVPVLTIDPSAQLGIDRPQGLPATYVFDPEGKLVARLDGEQTVESLAAAMKQGAQP